MTYRLIHSSNSTLNSPPARAMSSSPSAPKMAKGVGNAKREKDREQSIDEGTVKLHTIGSTGVKECKSLVIYLSSTSLSSTLKYKGFSSRLREMSNIPVHLQSILLGVLCQMDGYIKINQEKHYLL